MKASLRRAFLAALLTVSLALPAQAAPALWRISDKDSQVWLFGSVHLFDGRVKWRTPAFNKALKGADLVYFEMELSVTQQEYMASLLKLGMNRNGKKLSQYLNKAQRATLAEVVRRLKVDPEVVEVMRPWMAAVTLAGASGNSERTAVRVKPGVEMSLLREIPDSKERGLETLERQLRVFADMSDKGQVKFLMETISGTPRAQADSRLLMKKWADGDIDGLYPMIVESIGKPGTEWYNRLLTDRNKRWVSQITKLLATDDDVMVIVGAGHFAGPTGLPTLLKKRGITVERIQ